MFLSVVDTLADFKKHSAADTFKENVWGANYQTRSQQNAILEELYMVTVHELCLGLTFAHNHNRSILWSRSFDPEVMFNFWGLNIFGPSAKDEIKEHIRDNFREYIESWLRTVNVNNLTWETYVRSFPKRLGIQIFNAGSGLLCEYGPYRDSGIPKGAGMVRRVSRD